MLILRMIFVDLLKITVLSVVALSSLLTLVGALMAASKQGLDPLRVLTIMPLLIPPTFPYVLPTCLLFACTVVYSAMSSNHEITALKAGGINPTRPLFPALMLSVALAGLGVWMSDDFIPRCQRMMQEAILADLQNTMYSFLKTRGSIADNKSPYEIYVRAVQGEKLIQPIFKHRRGRDPGDYDLIAQASEAKLEIVRRGEDLFLRLHLRDGVATVGQQDSILFRDRTEEMPLPTEILKQEASLNFRDFAGCQQYLEERRQSIREAELQLTAMAAQMGVMGNHLTFWNQMPISEEPILRWRRKVREAEAAIHMRLTKATATIPFVLLGAPLTIMLRRREFLQSFFYSFLPIITLFYPVMILSFNVFKEGTITSPWILWLPTAILMVSCFPFLRNVIRY